MVKSAPDWVCRVGAVQGVRLALVLVVLLGACASDDTGPDGCRTNLAPLPETCGLNERGVPTRVCDGALVTDSCDDPDTCVDGQIHLGSGSACGFNGRGIERDLCVAGQPEPTCYDPDSCEEQEVSLSDVACGINGRGRRLQECFFGGWQVNPLSCSDPDVCLDGLVATRLCGENLRGTRTTSCVTGAWQVSACVYPAECLSSGHFDGNACPIQPPTLVTPTACPDVSEAGRITITSADEEREFLLYLPPDPVGKPVVVLWHQLGGSAAGFASITNASALATALDVIIAIPEMSYVFTLGDISAPMWRFLDVSPPGPDLALFDDILGCLDLEHGVDRTRLYTAGASAGGLFSTRLLLDRADVLAGVAILSGGTDAAHRLLNTTYVTPAAPTPALVAWGGESDQLTFITGFTIDFAAGSEALVNALLADGDVVVACDHGEGHTVPSPIMTVALEFLMAQRFGEPSPYSSPTPPTMPDACIVRAP